MAMKNRYAARAKLSERNLRRLVDLFAQDEPASQIAEELAMSRTTVNFYLRRIRQVLAEESILAVAGSPSIERGDILYSAAARSRGRRSPPYEIFRGLARRDGTVLVEVLPDREADALVGLRQGRLLLRGWYHRECVVGFSREVDLDFWSGEPDDLHVDLAASPVCGELVERFLAFARRRLAKFRGITLEMLRLHLKESEFRFNAWAIQEDLRKQVLAVLRKRPLR